MIPDQSNLSLSRYERSIVELNNDIRSMEKNLDQEKQFLKYLKRQAAKAALALSKPEVVVNTDKQNQQSLSPGLSP